MSINTPVRVPVDLDKRRHLLLDLAAVCRFEYNTKKMFFNPKIWNHLSSKDAHIMLWACLVADDPGLKPEDVVRIMRDPKIDQEKFNKQMFTAFELLINSFLGGKQSGNHSR